MPYLLPHDALVYWAKEDPERIIQHVPALTQFPEISFHECSYGDFYENVKYVANQWKENNILQPRLPGEKEKVVVLLIAPQHLVMILLHAVWFLGHTPFSVLPELPVEALVPLLSQMSPVHLIMHSQTTASGFDNIGAFSLKEKDIEELDLQISAREMRDIMHCVSDELLSLNYNRHPGPPVLTTLPLSIEEPEFLAYCHTSGTSGPPKIFKEPYRRMLHSPQSTYEDDTKRMSNWLRPAPWAYQSSIRYHVMQLQRGASQCSAHDISTPPSINRIVESAVYTNVHNIFLQPFQVEHILSEIEKHTKQGQNFVELLQGKTVLTGGAACSSLTSQLAAKTSRLFRIYNISGMTECPALLRSPIVSENAPNMLSELVEVDGGWHLAWEPIESDIYCLWILNSHPTLLKGTPRKALPPNALRKAGVSSCQNAFCTRDLYRSCDETLTKWRYFGRHDDRIVLADSNSVFATEVEHGVSQSLQQSCPDAARYIQSTQLLGSGRKFPCLVVQRTGNGDHAYKGDHSLATVIQSALNLDEVRRGSNLARRFHLNDRIIILGHDGTVEWPQPIMDATVPPLQTTVKGNVKRRQNEENLAYIVDALDGICT